MISRRTFIKQGASAATSIAALSALPASVYAAMGTELRTQTTLVVGYPAGGSTDAVARVLAAHLRGNYAESVIVENRTGAAGRVAADYSRRRAPDGASILFSPDAVMTLRPYLFKSITYNWQRDFTPISRVCGFPMVIFVGPSVPATVKSVADLVSWFKANPNEATYGTSAPGSTPHLAGVMFSKVIGQPLTAINYQGSAPAVLGLLSKQVPIFLGTAADALAHLQAGTVRALVTTGKSRSSALPDVPTLSELGYENSVVEDYFSVYLPAKASPELVASLNKAVIEATRNPEFLATLKMLAMDPVGGSPSELQAALRADSINWGVLVRDSGFKPED